LLVSPVCAILFFSGCIESLSPNTINPNSTTGFNDSTEVIPPKPLTDSAVIRARVLNVQTQSARLEILDLISYDSDKRDGTIKLEKSDINDFVFQWGTSATIIDMPPLGPSNTDVHLPGIAVGDIIQANISISKGERRVYQYEKIN